MLLFALIGMNLMTQESRIAEGKIKRLRAYYAVKAGMVRALEQLRKGVAVTNTSIGSGILGYPIGGHTVNITVSDPITTPGEVEGCRELNITSTY